MSGSTHGPSNKIALELMRRFVQGVTLTTTEKLELVTEAFRYMDDVAQLEFQIVMDIWKDYGATGKEIAFRIV